VDVHQDEVVLAPAVEPLEHLEAVLDDVGRMATRRADLLQDLEERGPLGGRSKVDGLARCVRVDDITCRGKPHVLNRSREHMRLYGKKKRYKRINAKCLS
jgi:hypothetical protein